MGNASGRQWTTRTERMRAKPGLSLTAFALIPCVIALTRMSIYSTLSWFSLFFPSPQFQNLLHSGLYSSLDHSPSIEASFLFKHHFSSSHEDHKGMLAELCGATNRDSLFQVGVIGVDVMGSMLALLFAENGVDVSIYDRSEENLRKAAEKAKRVGLAARVHACKDYDSLCQQLGSPKLLLQSSSWRPRR